MGLNLLQKTFRFVSCLVLLSLAVAAQAEPVQPGPKVLADDHIATSLEELLDSDNQFEAAEAVATYYAKRFEGRRTSSGQRYHPDKMTAAHYTLPMGTVVRVVNPKTNQEVQVTINDRCAPKKFNFIDLSKAAAKKIGLWGKGKIKVVIIPLADEPDDAEAPV